MHAYSHVRSGLFSRETNTVDLYKVFMSFVILNALIKLYEQFHTW